MKKIFLLSFLLFFLVNEVNSQTYYKYKRRNTSASQVDYSGAAKNISDKLMEAQRRRNAQLKARGWSSEAEYRYHKRFKKYQRKKLARELRAKRKKIKKENKTQKKLERKYLKGNDKVKKITLKDGTTKYIID